MEKDVIEFLNQQLKKRKTTEDKNEDKIENKNEDKIENKNEDKIKKKSGRKKQNFIVNSLPTDIKNIYYNKNFLIETLNKKIYEPESEVINLKELIKMNLNNNNEYNFFASGDKINNDKYVWISKEIYENVANQKNHVAQVHFNEILFYENIEIITIKYNKNYNIIIPCSYQLYKEIIKTNNEQNIITVNFEEDKSNENIVQLIHSLKILYDMEYMANLKGFLWIYYFLNKFKLSAIIKYIDENIKLISYINMHQLKIMPNIIKSEFKRYYPIAGKYIE